MMLFLCIIYSDDVIAIDPDKHNVVTRIAFGEYQVCISELSIEDTLLAGADTIIENSGKEDISPLLKRYFNWHFHDAYKDSAMAMGRSMTGARKSLHHIFNERIDLLMAAMKRHEDDLVYEQTGRILHYIQDVTVPAHVAPIFHYKFLWLDHSDYFDGMSEWVNTSYSRQSGLCDHNAVNVADAHSGLNLILDETAEQTRDRIRQGIRVEQGHRLHGKTWQEFWVLRDPADEDGYADTRYGFAPYGKQGRDGFEKLCDATGADRSLCLAFFKESFDAAINATVKTLLTINSIRLQNHSVP